MKRKTSSWLYAGIIFVCLAVLSWIFLFPSETEETTFEFITLETGTLKSIITATGTLKAVRTVEVGTQVSGTISNIYKDFNDEVRRGQVLAVIDTTFLAAAVRDARSNRVRSSAQLDLQTNEYTRIKELAEKQMVSPSEQEQAYYNLQVAKANLESARSSLERAEINLEYATIRSPVNGTIISRNVDIGQTVAASFSSPTLFLIADDLTRMQIEAQVDESDIGQIKPGQSAEFTVQAYSEKKFTGTVQQVRLNPEVVQNVVNYTVIVSVLNNENVLLPGMTATVEFIVSEAEDVLIAPASALKLRPTESMMQTIRDRMQARLESTPDSIRQQMSERFRSATSGSGQASGAGTFAGLLGAQRSGNMATIWFFDENNELQMRRVMTGITDGRQTEIRGRDLKAGMKLISRITTTEPVAETTSIFPNQGGPTDRMMRRGF